MPDRKNFLKAAATHSERIKRCFLDERDVVNTWRSLFQGKELTKGSLSKAATLLDGLTGESPLHIRLAKELEELRKLLPKK